MRLSPKVAPSSRLIPRQSRDESVVVAAFGRFILVTLAFHQPVIGSLQRNDSRSFVVVIGDRLGSGIIAVLHFKTAALTPTRNTNSS